MADDAETQTTDEAAAQAAATGADTTAGASTDSGGATTPAADSGVITGSEGADAVRPAELPESLWDEATKAPKWSDIQARLTRADDLEAAETARGEGVPDSVEGYTFEVTGDPILGGDGQPAAIDADNPLAKAVAAVAHQHKVPQGVVSDFVRAFVQTEVDGESQLREAIQAEEAKLGEKARERVTAVQDWLKANVGDHAPSAIQALGSAGAVQAWEAVIAKLAGATVTAPAGTTTRKFGDGWFPSMKSNAG